MNSHDHVLIVGAGPIGQVPALWRMTLHRVMDCYRQGPGPFSSATPRLSTHRPASRR
jgi:hypothetical protein